MRPGKRTNNFEKTAQARTAPAESPECSEAASMDVSLHLAMCNFTGEQHRSIRFHHGQALFGRHGRSQSHSSQPANEPAMTLWPVPAAWVCVVVRM